VPALSDPALSYPSLITLHSPSKPACGCPSCLAAAGLLRTAAPLGSGGQSLSVLSQQGRSIGTSLHSNSDDWIAALLGELSGEGTKDNSLFPGFGFTAPA
jgi:hypothetical protein